MKPKAGSKIVVGMSGGVDSSVAAALLKNQGYEVIGIMLRLWSDQGTQNRCCAPDAQDQARFIAGLLDIPFYVIDAQDSFYQNVVVPFIDGYAQGITPNPCINCNRFIRWSFLLDRAKSMGATILSTGHYARIQEGPDNELVLHKGLDDQKDQSYVLHVLTQVTLKKTYFPLGDLSKTQVRKLAKEYSLPVADRPDSQDLCFVGQGDYRDFLRKDNPTLTKTGPIQDLSGNQIGEHNGLIDFTIGQRKGLGLSGSEPFYVLGKDLQNNILIVGLKEDLGRNEFYADQINWISGKKPRQSIDANIKIRYKSSEVPGIITLQEGDSVRINLSSSLPDITPGQAAVFYQEDLCLGGGIIRTES